MGDGVRARTHQRHLAGQDVEKLRQLVKAGGAQEAADAGDTGIAPGRLRDVCAVFQHMHAAEFVDAEKLAVLAGAALAEQYGAARIRSDCQGDGGQQRQAQKKDDAGKGDIQHPLGAGLVRRKGQTKAVQGGKHRLHGRLGIILNAHRYALGKGLRLGGCRSRTRKNGAFSARFGTQSPVFWAFRPAARPALGQRGGTGRWA